MSDVKIDFSGFSAPSRGVLVVFCDESLKLGPATRKALGEAVDLVTRAAAADRFKGKLGGALDIVAPAGLRSARLVVVGCGKVGDLKAKDYARLGGIAAGKIPSAAGSAHNSRRTARWTDEARPGGGHRARGHGCGPTSSTATRPRRRTMSRGRRISRLRSGSAIPANVAQGVGRAQRARGRRQSRPRSRQRAAEHPFSRRICSPRVGVAQTWRRGRNSRRQGDAETWHGRAVRCRAGLGARQPAGDHALERRTARRQAGVVCRQGCVLRYRRHFDQAGGAAWKT